MTAARFDLAALLAATELVRDGHGRLELRFHYPASETGEPVLRRVVRPHLIHTAGGQVRTFTCACIAASPAPRAHHATTEEHRMTDPLTRTAAAHAGVLCGEQAGARLLLHHLHAAVSAYDRAVALESSRRRDTIALLETLFDRGPRPLSAAEPATFTALTARLDRQQDARVGRLDAETRLSEVVADVACGPGDALLRHARREQTA